MKTNQMYEEQAKNWITSGRPVNLLMSDVPLAALRCWHTTHIYQKTPDISPAIAEYLAACEAILPENWYFKVMCQRYYCAGCGDTYKISNLSICTRCHDVYCPKCANLGVNSGNGFSHCRCGGELVG